MSDDTGDLCGLQKFGLIIKNMVYHWIFLDFIFSFLIFLAVHLLATAEIVTVIDIEDFFSSMKDIFIELFGFAGLIIVFAYGYLLNTKSEFTKFKIEREFQSSTAVYQVGDQSGGL